ncbi:MAG: LysM peptidoglycan-binding domain-containing protein [Akkermansia sp.]|nr:LysM peptidoglycan-binding domain-containing protein [Akkermansia sp.]
MRKDTKATFRNSDLGRAKPKRHFLKTFVDENLKEKRHYSDTGLVVDRTSPATVLRIIFGLIVVHLLVIGGVMLRGNITKSNSGPAVVPTITPPPAIPVAEARPVPAVDAAPAPAPAQPAVAATPAPAQPAANDTHITQAPINMEAVTAPVQPVATVEPVAVQPAPAPAAPATPSVEVKHLVNSGDTWGRVAAQYGITEDVLKGANPSLAARTNLPGGTYLTVPVPADSAAAQAAQAAKPVVKDTARYHVVKRGENLGLIARKYKLSLPKLLKLNNMTNADARRLKVGRKLKVSE